LPETIDRASLIGVWTHSHEEDQPDIHVFRSSGYAFPRSRGRVSYELRPDGTLGGTRPGPDDRHVPSTGRWDLQGRRLVITPEGGSPIQYEVESLGSGRMMVKPVGGQ
jgi:hypothetical protein